MSGGPSAGQSVIERFGLRGCTSLVLALLAVSLPQPAGAGPAAAASTSDQAPAGDLALDELSTTIDDLKASLTAIRQDLEAMRASPEDDALPEAEPRCGETVSVPELARLRQDLAIRDAELVRLRSEGARLKSRIAELETVIRQARTREVVAALVQRPAAAPIEMAAAAELDARSARRSGPNLAPSAEASEAAAPVGSADPDGGPHLQLRAELALAQLKIAELTDELRSRRASQAALEAELTSLRLLTDAKIRGFMGWQ